MRYHKRRIDAAARYGLEGEEINRYWSEVNREVKPRDLVHELKVPESEPAKYKKRSDKMANIVKTFFDDLQRQPYNVSIEEREVITEEVLTNVITHEEDMSKLDEEINEEDVWAALRSMENGKATGLDGIPYDLYKALHRIFLARSKDEGNEKDLFDIIETLTMVFQDIEKYGTDPLEENGFAEGWICPLYKKNDPRLPSNYRPITLLNADYKIYTKALTMKLAKVAPNLIHENQAGFVPNRSIFDHVQLSKLMIQYAEATEENGAIIALDQEKAYDRIAHDYLWKTLKKFKIPDRFINAVKSLYNNATSIVILNGERSEKFKITRGVRQGDPLSCLLFDLAIEPLAEMLRRSDLEGYEIPGTRYRLITTLFADDTTVYLSAGDSIETLEKILGKWCKASGAKFNLDKTEIIPIGTEEYRKRVIETRQMNPESEERIPGHMKLAIEGQPVRSLGAWMGNNIDQATPWTKTIEKITAALDRWKKCSPTLRGKRLIAQMIIGGMTQYLTKVQGMPKATEKALMKIQRDFIWDTKKPMVSMDRLSKLITEGGIKLIDITSRNEAIELMWMKSYLDLSEKRPTWAFAMDVLIGQQITRNSGDVHRLSQVNKFLQTWRVNTSGPSKLPEDIKRMLRVSKKYNLTCNAIKVDSKIKKALPAWYHIGAKKSIKMMNNSISGKCLREKHMVKTIGDLLKIKKRLRRSTNPDHVALKTCTCIFCESDRRTRQCDNPDRCANAAAKIIRNMEKKWRVTSKQPKDGLSLTENRIKGNQEAKKENRQITFDPTTTLKEDVSRLFRVFSDPSIPTAKPGYRPLRGADVAEEETDTYIETAQARKKNRDPRTGCGIRLEREIQVTNLAIRVTPRPKPAADITALIIALQSTPDFAPLHIKTTSSALIKTFTEELTTLEQGGWFGTPNATLIRTATALLRRRSARTTMQWFGKKNLSIENQETKNIARRAMMKPTITETPTKIPDRFNLTGAELATITQASAYRAIRETKKIEHTETTTSNIANVEKGIQNLSGFRPEVQQIWRTLRDKAIERPVSDFLWKVAHGIHKVGKYWKNIPGFEERGQCPKCETTETMEHILFECQEPGQTPIWGLAEEVWSRTGHEWPGHDLITLLGGGLLRFEPPEIQETEERDKRKKKKKKDGRQRLLTILLTESAYLIWKLRNERRIRDAALVRGGLSQSRTC